MKESQFSQYRDRPSVAKASYRPNLDDRGRTIPDPDPHPDLLAGGRPLTIAEQVAMIERVSALRRASVLDNVSDDEIDDFVEAIFDEDGGLRVTSPHEIQDISGLTAEETLVSYAQHKSADKSPAATQKQAGDTADTSLDNSSS